MKLWDKGTPVNKAIEDFTVGKDRELDLYLAPYDILGSMAHITMLESVGLIEKEELPVLLEEFKVWATRGKYDVLEFQNAINTLRNECHSNINTLEKESKKKDKYK